MRRNQLITSALLGVSLLFASCSSERYAFRKTISVDEQELVIRQSQKAVEITTSPESAKGKMLIQQPDLNKDLALADLKTINPVVASKPASVNQAGSSVAAEVNTTNSQTNKTTMPIVKKKAEKVMSVNDVKGSGKSQLVALLLCIFVGGLGIHRFYLGYTWQGVVQLLTLGGCGIWALIDLVRIIIGDLGPKNGGYTDTL